MSYYNLNAQGNATVPMNNMKYPQNGPVPSTTPYGSNNAPQQLNYTSNPQSLSGAPQQPYKSSGPSPYNPAAPSFNATTPPYNASVPPPYNASVPPPYNAAPPPFNASAPPPFNASAPPPFNASAPPQQQYNAAPSQYNPNPSQPYNVAPTYGRPPMSQAPYVSQPPPSQYGSQQNYNSFQGQPMGAPNAYQAPYQPSGPMGMPNMMGGPMAPGSAVSLVKGGNLSLSKAVPNLRHIKIGLGWDVRQSPGAPFDLDASVFMVKADGRVRSAQDLIFYNNKQSIDGSVFHHGDNLTGVGEGDDEQLSVDLTNVPYEIQKIVCVVSIYEAEMRGQNFGMVSRAFIRVVNADNNQEIVRFDLTEEASMFNCMVFGEVYRYNGEWKFRAIGQGVLGGLKATGPMFGINMQ